MATAAMVEFEFHQRMNRRPRRPRLFRDRTNPLDSYDDVEFIKKYRFSRRQVMGLTDEIRSVIEHKSCRGGALLAILQVCIALRFYACGSIQMVLGEGVGVDQSTICRVITRVTNALHRLVPNYIQMPTQEQANEAKRKFFRKARFPNVFGCIDGTHIRILAPSVNEAEYVNRKNFHSINVQIICDADLRIINAIAKWPGSVHDARILRESALFTDFETARPLNGIILGDSGYMLRDWLMTPFNTPQGPHQEAYNFAHVRTRVTVERCIGVAKQRWRCLKEMRLNPVKVGRVTLVCFMLHNRAISMGLPIPEPEEVERDIPPPYRAEGNGPDRERARATAGQLARNQLIERYFW